MTLFDPLPGEPVCPRCGRITWTPDGTCRFCGAWQQAPAAPRRAPGRDAPGKVRRDHPDTSHAAAQLVMPRTGTQRRAVLDFVAHAGEKGATDRELQYALQLPGNSERPRRVELVEAGWLVDSGVRREGHIVWLAADPNA